MDVTTRLWLAGVVSTSRDRRLIDCLFQHVGACCQFVQDLLVCTDGFAAYPNSIVRAFREKVKQKAGPGRCRLQAWPGLCIATVMKRTEKKRVVEVTRKLTRGALTKAQALLQMTVGCQEFNTSFIERFNATMRERLAPLTRRCRHAVQRLETLEAGMFLIGCSYNFCLPHQELSKATHFGYPCAPAMAAGLTDHIWSIRELLMYQVAPDAWVEPKRPGRPRKVAGASPPLPKRPRGRPRKHPLPDPSVPKRPRGRPPKVA